jgi:hypothetical protein
MTGCGCLLLVALLVAGITFMIFGSTDPGEPIAQSVRAASLIVTAGALARVASAPFRRSLVRPRRA